MLKRSFLRQYPTGDTKDCAWEQLEADTKSGHQECKLEDRQKRTLRQIMTHKAQHRMLNAHLFRINITNDPKSQCGAPFQFIF